MVRAGIDPARAKQNPGPGIAILDPGSGWSENPGPGPGPGSPWSNPGKPDPARGYLDFGPAQPTAITQPTQPTSLPSLLPMVFAAIKKCACVVKMKVIKK